MRQEEKLQHPVKWKCLFLPRMQKTIWHAISARHTHLRVNAAVRTTGPWTAHQRRWQPLKYGWHSGQDKCLVWRTLVDTAGDDAGDITPHPPHTRCVCVCLCVSPSLSYRLYVLGPSEPAPVCKVAPGLLGNTLGFLLFCHNLPVQKHPPKKKKEKKKKKLKVANKTKNVCHPDNSLETLWNLQNCTFHFFIFFGVGSLCKVLNGQVQNIPLWKIKCCFTGLVGC